MQGKQVKRKFLRKSGEDRRQTVQKIKKKIESGYFSSDIVIRELVEKLGPQFASVIPE